ncbi:MAG TPA: PilZ domain-containing protein [Candidatus Aquilonibacter sp.]|nr:PilZ domain-containing protein [Candidatus Aquilonibacter sp.]
MTDRRREPRVQVNLPLRVWGTDSQGERFLQEVHARDISLSGALLSELEVELRPGDLIGVQYEGKQARFRVVWLRHSGDRRKIQAAIHRLSSDQCPWLHLLGETSETAAFASLQVP